MTAHEDLGRRRGVFVPVTELQLLDLLGWRLLDDLGGLAGLADRDVDRVLVAPPAAYADGAV